MVDFFDPPAEEPPAGGSILVPSAEWDRIHALAIRGEKTTAAINQALGIILDSCLISKTPINGGPQATIIFCPMRPEIVVEVYHALVGGKK